MNLKELKLKCVDYMLQNGYHMTERSYTEIVSDKPIGPDGPEDHIGELEYWTLYTDKGRLCLDFDNNGCSFEIESLEDLKHVLVRKS